MKKRNHLIPIFIGLFLVGGGMLLVGFLSGSPAPADNPATESEEMDPQYMQEAPEKLSPKTKDLHRAIQSLVEELQAVDWYQQRVDVVQDEALKNILAHNRDEEKEHCAMLMEWIRRNDKKFAEVLKEYLFTEKEIAHK